ncbi:MAG: phosphonate monoester hydrolase [Burkholderiaceae bacterium]|jgi:arylsulfatase A-like enzyme|uniref:Phosphonate monoester hydrolase n=1 Tax=Cupriavidus metallidurans TaxID=119219 RepID=A0A482IQB5_9BURK|nr:MULTISPECIES: sulfatase-like hydrolase/transferase [Cupriavidus]KWR78230.1 phosphonate monoester hydrolase [Cupriavidus sp. SHE]PCH55236.1 MAG: phosphonate monoester hydrolase [Burkholderiaceae bacterium]QBP09783.1 phosphonate monoester hydrolase [Cupriavidus metallidurans]QWC90119.1 sulfatase-like hydrolase/transferase [Cupriavidus metallidurans]
MSVRNVLFIMCDQLRRDHLGCYGHPTLRTRNIDALAARGVRFDNAFVTSGVCGPSRMSFYTGRYVSSHGATWNRVPLSIGEITLGEYLKDGGLALALAGKTHVMPDSANLKRLHLDGGAELETLLRSGHFVEVDRHDGHHAEPRSPYADWLRAQGYDSADPWTDYVISAQKPDGEVVSGWHMRNAGLPARVAEPHSETAYTVDRAMDYIGARGDEPWVLHLSLVKPHWPYIAPAPYHAAYSLDDCLPLNRDDVELEHPHPVLDAYRTQEECANFMRKEVSDTVRPAYQGLIQQIDDRLGQLWELLERTGRWQDTLIVFTADHGDFLGDHWLGEKEQFYDTVQNVPLIVYDPSAQADATRGTADARMVSAVDVVPTVLDSLGMPAFDHRVEGRSLLDLTRARTDVWRGFVVSELDYGYRGARVALGRHPGECRAWMVRDTRWKYVHWQGFRPQLFDLLNDPNEIHDLGEDAGHESVRAQMRGNLLDWFCTLKPRVTVTNEEVAAKTNVYKQAGVFFGVW